LLTFAINSVSLVLTGLMGYFGIPFDMGLMVVIPILLGIAVDDTIHFISYSQVEFQRSGQYRLSVQRTFASVGKALFMTTFILVASFTMFMTLVAAFFLHLGALMTVGFVSALLADYCLTPVLILVTALWRARSRGTDAQGERRTFHEQGMISVTLTLSKQDLDKHAIRMLHGHSSASAPDGV
jgi:uncharacterized protein